MTMQEFRRSYELAPILLVNGIAADLPNGQASILLLTEGTDTANYATANEYFARFKPLPGGTLIDFSAAQYPIYSMAMAANAMLQNGLKISLRMECPPRTNANNYPSLQATMTRLQQQLNAHINAGGSFIVGTPGFIYSNCLLVGLHDVTGAAEKVVQAAYQWDFIQPLITEAAAAQVYGNLVNKLTNGFPVPNPPTQSGVSVSIGNAPTSQRPTNPEGPAT